MGFTPHPYQIQAKMKKKKVTTKTTKLDQLKAFASVFENFCAYLA